MKIYLFILITSVMVFSCKGPNGKTADQATTIKKTQDKMDSVTRDYIDMDYVTGRFEPSQHPSFIIIDKKYTPKDDIFLNREAYAAFVKMHAAAQADHINLVIRSAARNFDYQRGIWERKWTGATKLSGDIDASSRYPAAKDRAKAILLYSSMPGTSRHHWGTDIDLNDFENTYFEHGQGLKEYTWLQDNADRFGFCQTYTAKDDSRPTGYEEEKWHWSYLPIAKEVLKLANEQLKNEDISGFKGAQTAIPLNIVNNYVLGINPNCK